VILLQSHQAAVAAQFSKRLDDQLKFVPVEAGAPLNFRGCQPFPGLAGKQSQNFFLSFRFRC
jgi:hypothetical protein